MSHHNSGQTKSGRRGRAADNGHTNGAANGHANNTTAGDEKQEGRAGDGRFAPGNGGGPGNPYARQVAAFRRAVHRAVSEEDIEEIARVVKEKAKAGDMGAARLLYGYSMGRAIQPPTDPDSVDAHELQVRRQSVASVEDMRALFEAMPASLMCELARTVSPQVREHLAEAFALGVRRQGEHEEACREHQPEAPGPYPADKADWAAEWLRKGWGMSDGVSKVFEASPMWMPDISGSDRVGHRYEQALRGMREGILAGLRLDDNRHWLVPPADWKRLYEERKRASLARKEAKPEGAPDAAGDADRR